MPRSSRQPRAKTAAPFLRSLNVERDFGSLDATDRYVLTSNALRATRRILDAVEGGVGGAWALVGPFGTGKSAFCLYLAHLLARAGDDATGAAIERLRQVDRELARRAFPDAKKRLGLEPILISGSSEPIAAAIASALATSPFLQDRKATASIRLKAQKLHRAALDHQPTTDEVVGLLEATVEATKGRGDSQGILLILDELGKFLEFAATHAESADVFLLQQLAELAVRSNGHLAVIGVLHQDFREYAAMLPSVERAEWEKIRGRFEDIAFEEPPSQLLRFVAAAAEQCRQTEATDVPKEAERAVVELAPELWDLGLAPPGLDAVEGQKLLRLCTPLHPLVASLLGPVFRRVGQNERSAFSFLASEEPSALRAWLRSGQSDGRSLFDIVDLHYHLFSSLGNALLHAADAKRWAEAFEAESRHPGLSAPAVAVLRAIALLSIASRWYGVRASRDVLQYALTSRMKPDTVDGAIEQLLSASIVVHRRYNDSYAIWEGSDVDIESRLQEGRTRVGETVGAASILDKHFHVRPLLARRHSYLTGTLRFFDVLFTESAQLDQLGEEESERDGRLVVVLPGRGQVSRPTAECLRRFRARTLLLFVSPEDNLPALAVELAAIEWAERNTPELSHDSTARRELYARRAEVEKQLAHLVESVLSTQTKGRLWFYKGGRIHVHDRRELNERLSRICDDVFRDAPRIDNEIINRQELSSSAAAARRNLIQRMIECKDQSSLGLEGNPPERSVYRSLLSREGLALHRLAGDTWAFRFPPASHRGKTGSAYELFQAIGTFLADAEASPRPVSDLFELLRQPPFGLRDGPIPVLVCAALLAREADVALYRMGEFQPTLTAALFEDLIKRSSEFTIRRLRITGVRAEVFDQLGKLLGQMQLGERSAKQQVVTIARLLMRFIKGLSEFAQRTESLAPQTLTVRATLLSAKEPETMLLADLPQAIGLRPFTPQDRRRSHDVPLYVGGLKEAIVELRDALPRLTATIWQALGDAFGAGSRPGDIRATIRDRASAMSDFAVERDLRMLLERFLSDTPSDETWLEGVASLISERLPAKWRDEDRAHFSIRLRQFTRRFTLLEATVASRPRGAKLNGAESIRVALTSTRFGQLDHALLVDPQSEPVVREMESQIRRLVDSTNVAHAVPALCRALAHCLDGDHVADNRLEERVFK